MRSIKNKKYLLILLISLNFYIQLFGKFKLITSLYNETNEERCKEYITCFKKNLEHPLIHEIIVFYDTIKDLDGKNSILDFLLKQNVIIIYGQGHPSFYSMFEEANRSKKGNGIIIANADIYFNDTLFLLKEYDLGSQILCLTRWDDDGKGNLKPFMKYSKEKGFEPKLSSQDVWIFQSPISIEKRRSDNIFVGTLGCENRIAYEASDAGLVITNPCLSIQCCHLHNSGVRNYSYEDRFYTSNRLIVKIDWEKLI